VHPPTQTENDKTLLDSSVLNAPSAVLPVACRRTLSTDEGRNARARWSPRGTGCSKWSLCHPCLSALL